MVSGAPVIRVLVVHDEALIRKPPQDQEGG
jgi:hypothetical protein